MKRCSTLILLISTVTYAAINEIQASKRNAKPIQLRGKQISVSQLQSKPNQTAKLPNAKRWMPSKKTNVKYVAKLANNTKRWMPGFAQMGQDDMESSMMYDSGYVSSDQESSFSQPQQQQPGEFGLQQQPQQQGIGPEQSFLTPGSSDQGINIPGGGAPFQGIGNEIESFTKDGLDDSTGGNSMYNTYDYQDPTFNNPKFQEGDYVGVPLQENANKPNLYDAFTIEPGMAENFVNPMKNKGGNSGSTGSEDDKDEKQQNKGSKNEGKAKSDKEKKLSLKQKSKENEKATKNAKLDEKVEEPEGKDRKAKASNESDKEVEKTKEGNEKEANDVAETMESKTATKEREKQRKEDNSEEVKEEKEGKEEKEEKEEKSKDHEENVKKISKNDKENEDEKELNISKEKGAGENSQQESEKAEKLVTNEEKNEEKGENQLNEKEVDAKKEESNKKEEEKDLESKADAEKVINKIINKKLKMLSSRKPKKVMKDEEESESESVKGGNDEDTDDKKVGDANQTKNSQAMNKADKNSSEQKGKESKTAEELDNAEEENENKEADSRISKLKQRIRAQKMTKSRGRLQQDAAARYKISSDGSDGTAINNALASNVAPGSAVLGMAAEGLRKQLVSNLRNALMKNFASAIAKGGHLNAAGGTGGTGGAGGAAGAAGGAQNAESNQNFTPQVEQQSNEVQGSSEQGKHQQDPKTQYSNRQNSVEGPKANGETNVSDNSNENQPESNKGKDNSEQSLVPTLMKMDKTMLVDTILKLLKNQKEGSKDGEKQSVGEDRKKKKEDKEDDQSAGTLNQSFQSNREAANERESAKQENPETKENDVKQESGEEQQGNEKSDENSNDSKSESNENEPGTHAEYSMYPVKAEGSAKYYKLKKLAGQGHIKGKLVKAPGSFDPYAQIGLADPGNNDKITAHHKSSNLKEDLDQQEPQNTKSEVDSESQSGREESSVEAPNQEENSKLSAMNEQANQNTNQDSDQQSSESQLLNGNQEQKVVSYQQSMDQPSNQIANQELTKSQKTEKDSPIQQSTVTVQDGVTTETNINADSPQMVAQLMKISQRLHGTNDKKPTQNDDKETSNSKSFTNNVKLPDLRQKLHYDAYSSIGSFDPNVKKKAAIGKKKLLITKQILQNDVISKRGSMASN